MDTPLASGPANASASRRRKTPLARSGFYGKVMRGSFYLLTFLLPLFFLPWTTDAFEINKQILLIILGLVSLMAWLGSMVMEKRLVWRRGVLNLFPLLFILSVLVSSCLSLAGYQTWVGQATQEYSSFLTTLMFVVLFYVVANGFGETKAQQPFFFALLFSAAISGILNLFNIFGISLGFMGNGFNTVGTVNAFVL